MLWTCVWTYGRFLHHKRKSLDVSNNSVTIIQITVNPCLYRFVFILTFIDIVTLSISYFYFRRALRGKVSSKVGLRIGPFRPTIFPNVKSWVENCPFSFLHIFEVTESCMHLPYSLPPYFQSYWELHASALFPSPIFLNGKSWVENCPFSFLHIFKADTESPISSTFFSSKIRKNLTWKKWWIQECPRKMSGNFPGQKHSNWDVRWIKWWYEWSPGSQVT